MPDGTIGVQILVDSSLAWVIDSLNTTRWSTGQRRRDRGVVLLRLSFVHEASEILLESHPQVTWELDAIERESSPLKLRISRVLYGNRISLSDNRDSWRNFEEMSSKAIPLLLNFYRIALHGDDPMPHPVSMTPEHPFMFEFMRTLGYPADRYNTAQAAGFL